MRANGKLFFTIIFTVTLLITLALSESCSHSSTEPETIPNEIDTYKQIVQNAVNVTASGFGGVLESFFPDTESKTTFCRSYINYNRYFPDKAGYYYVNDLNGINIAHGTNMSLQDQNRYDVVDSEGKYYIRELLDNVINNRYDFVTYIYTNPSTGNPEQKYAYAERIPGSDFALTSGFYRESDDGYIDEVDKNKIIVEGIVRTFVYGSRSICNTLIPSADDQITFFRKFVEKVKYFDDSSGYMFVVKLNGVVIAHGADKTMEGTYVYDLKDSRGTYFIRDMIDIAQHPGSGYVEYYWANQVSGEEEKKLVYVENIQGMDSFVGAGVYLK